MTLKFKGKTLHQDLESFKVDYPQEDGDPRPKEMVN